MTPLEKHIKESDRLNRLVDATSDKLNNICHKHKSRFGLVSDEFRATPAYKIAKKEYDTAFKNLRDYNKKVPKKLMQKAAVFRREQKMND